MQASPADTIASALLANGVSAFRLSPVSGTERGPFCLMGVCFDCLVEVDGVPNRQACMVAIEDGMRVCRQTTDEATLS